MKTGIKKHLPLIPPKRLYPTFEEWKRKKMAVVLLTCMYVYILPLRNENFEDGR